VDHVEVQVGDAASLVPAGANAPPARRDVAPEAAPLAPPPGRWARFLDGDFWHSFRSSPMAISPRSSRCCASSRRCSRTSSPARSLQPGDARAQRFDAAAVVDGGRHAKYLLGTDEQGRDVLSALMFGARISLFVGAASVLLSLLIGVTLGLLSGYVGGRLDALIMRVCDVMLSFPSILIALLFAGVGHAIYPNAGDSLAFSVVIVAIALPGWVQYARAVRGSTMVERNKEYVQAARVIGVAPARIMLRHVLPNVMGPVLVLSTIQVAVAILAEATLSFLGVGVSPTSPSLGTFINEGNKQLFSGAWWLVIFPGATLVLIALSINLFGDWLRDALNPRLR
jgi:peptide/nickel transport system permease protein